MTLLAALGPALAKALYEAGTCTRPPARAGI